MLTPIDLRHRVARRVAASRPSRSGTAVGLLFFCTSMTPSLLPRSWLAQGLISGVATSVGYGIGVTGGWAAVRVVHALPARWHPRRTARRLTVRVVLSGSVVLVCVSLVAGESWQRHLHELMGVEAPPAWTFARVPLVALALVSLLVGGTRTFTSGCRVAVHGVRTHLPEGPARTLGSISTLLVVALLTESMALGGFLAAADHIWSGFNDDLTGQRSPVQAERSGSPDSLVAWSSLGSEGRDFVSGGPSLDDLRGFSGTPAREPIRVYVGLRSAPDPRTAARLAVAELDRTGAFRRKVLCVVTTTGTGWVDPYAAAALEYLHGGDTAIVGVQYSYLPSWISYLSEGQRVREAGPELFRQVHARWSQLPADRRPLLVVFAESLGSLGSESGFGSLDAVRTGTDGVLWAGPTHANPLWRGLQARREPGTRQVAPVVDGGALVRFAATPADLDVGPRPWVRPRIVYLQNASDPVTWWSPELAWEEPEWLREPRGSDVLPSMQWYPVVTFLQITADLALAYGAPPGHGHRFHATTVAAWAAITPVPGWTPRRTAELSALLGP